MTASILPLVRERPLAGLLGLFGVVLTKVHNRVSPEALALIRSWAFIRRNGGRFSRLRPGYWQADIHIAAQPLTMLLRSRSSDIQTFAGVMWRGDYLPAVQWAQRSLSGSVQLIVDVGANIGASALFLNAHFPGAQLACVEPDPANAALLRENLSLNNCAHAQVFEQGLWPHEGRLSLVSDFRDGAAWSRRVVEMADGPVPALGVASFVRSLPDGPIDILKVDIEGAEFPILRNREAASLLLQRTRFLALELHPEYGSTEEIEAILAEAGFLVFRNHSLIYAARLSPHLPAFQR